MMGGMIIPCRMRVRGWAWRRVEREREIGEERSRLLGSSALLSDASPVALEKFYPPTAALGTPEWHRCARMRRDVRQFRLAARGTQSDPQDAWARRWAKTRDNRQATHGTPRGRPEVAGTAHGGRAACRARRPTPIGTLSGGPRRWAGGRGCV